MMNNKNNMKTCIKHNVKYSEIKYIWKGKPFISGCIKCHLEKVKVKGNNNFYGNKKIKVKNDKNRISTLFRESGIPPRYTTRTIDNFKVSTEQQRRVLLTIKNYVNDFDNVVERGTSMIMTGGVGTGKTHLASAIANFFINRGKSVAFMTIATMFRKIRETYRSNSKNTEQKIINDIGKVDLLVLDEIGSQKGSDSEKYLLFEVLNKRYGYFKPTIIISNLDINDIRKYIGARVMDRFKEGRGKLAVFSWESYRKEVLQDKKLPSLSQSKY